MTISLVPDYAGDIALRSDGPVVFPPNAEAQYTYLALFSVDWNVTIGQMNTDIATTNDNVIAAAASAGEAAASETNAGDSAGAAATSETNAGVSETNAGGSAAAALISEGNAATSETNAGDSAGAAATSETNAGVSEGNAATSETNAGVSETNAADSETNAGISEVNSANSASASEQSAGESATSAAISQSNANFDGKWSTKTGAKTVPYSVNDDTGDGQNYQLLEDIGNIAASQPSLNPAQWKLIVTRALTEPDVKISFNDGITMERGYGTVDANGNRAIDYTRASTSGNINKSGVSETLAVNEPGITENGMSVYGAYANDVLSSEDYSDTSAVAWLYLGAVPPTITQDGTLSSDGVNQAWKIDKTVAGANRLQSNLTTIVAIETRVVCFEIKRGNTDTARIASGESTELVSCVFNFNTGLFTLNEGNAAKAYKLNNGWWRIFQKTTSTTTGTYVIQCSTNTNDVGYVYSSRAMRILDGSYNGPYIKTTTVPVTRAPDIASIPMMNNMPAQGKPFTIQTVCNMFNADDFGSAITVFDAINSKTVQIRRAVDGKLSATIKTTDGEFFAPQSHLIINKDSRYIVKYTSNSLEVYVNGVITSQVAVTGIPIYSLADDIYIGQNGQGSYLNSETKDNFIWHSALSSEEIAARGAA